jgi:hypothetical protein
MENEELFAGEPALDAQQQASDAQRAATAAKRNPLQIHAEPLLADDAGLDQQPYAEPVPSIDERPRWRRPHVSALCYRRRLIMFI